MAENSTIEWTDATWNPVVGCSIVSPGCTNCYAMRMAARIEKMMPPERRGQAILPHHYTALTKPSNAGPVWTGRVNIAPNRIFTQPLRWTKPKRIFVNSMGDLFHESIPDELIDSVFAVMALCPQHVFQVLTKRAARMRDYCSDNNVSARIWPLACEMGQPGRALSATLVKFGSPWRRPNVWLGVSAERQQEWDERKEHLRTTPAAVRFASFEPLLGQIVEPRPMSDYLEWAIVGGESGPHARPMHPDWARSLRDQCAAARVPFFFKQWGEWAPFHYRDDGKPKRSFSFDGASTVHRIGKSAAGRALDNVEYSEFPQ